jgi:hypothetical protein
MVLYILGLGLSHGLLMPNVRRIIGLQEELIAMGPPPAGATGGQPPPQVVELEESGRRVGAVSAVLQVDLVVILMLMVWGPRF